ncbi:hypothetical protein EV360DRAFT_88029 [Lentinula raphanica]|nr:hypothetical protein EV360DRAFT_88029 [Lentinula raphanica]
MNTSAASTVSNNRSRTPELQERTLRPRKQVRPNYIEFFENTVRNRPSRRRGKVPVRFRRVRGVYAFLARMLTDLPVEIIYLEIFSYLDSRDLLMMSRTCWSIRRTLLSKSAEYIWRTARFNVEGNLPPLPKDLNEPQYARLLFDPECHKCNKSSRWNMYLWKFRLRCCRDCVKGFCVYEWRYLSEKLYPFTSLDIIPRETVRENDVDNVIVDFRRATNLRAQFMALGSEEDRHSWIVQKREDHQAIVQHARLCEAWHQDELARRATRLITLRTERLEAILTRLEVVGLRQDAQLILDGNSNLKRPGELADLPCIKQSKELTDRGWACIRSNLINMLTDHRTTRLAQQNYLCLREEYYDSLSHQDLRKIYPGLGDVLTDPVIEATLWDTGREDALTPTFVQMLLVEFFSRVLDEWRATKTEELLVILRTARPFATAGDLYLATTIFGCAACNALMVCPQVFYHHCCYKTRAADNQSHLRMQIMNKLYDTVDQEGPWSSRSLFFHSQSSQIIQRIINDASLDPTTATISELTVAQPVIECTSLQADVFSERLFVTWPAALTYNLTANDKYSFIVNGLGEETSRIRAREPLSQLKVGLDSPSNLVTYAALFNLFQQFGDAVWDALFMDLRLESAIAHMGLSNHQDPDSVKGEGYNLNHPWDDHEEILVLTSIHKQREITIQWMDYVVS